MVNFATAMQVMGELYLEKRLAEEQAQANANAAAELSARVEALEAKVAADAEAEANAVEPIVLHSVDEGDE